MPAHDDPVPSRLSRRALLQGAGTIGVAGPLLAACAGGDGSGGAGSTGSTGSTGSSPGGSGGEVTIATADVPVGGGTILGDQLVVVTQPTEGTFEAFSAVCTHQGCPVQSVSDGAIICNCHGSRFSIEDGSVLQGPATTPLPSKQVSVEGDSVTVG